MSIITFRPTGNDGDRTALRHESGDGQLGYVQTGEISTAELREHLCAAVARNEWDLKIPVMSYTSESFIYGDTLGLRCYASGEITLRRDALGDEIGDLCKELDEPPFERLNEVDGGTRGLRVTAIGSGRLLVEHIVEGRDGAVSWVQGVMIYPNMIKALIPGNEFDAPIDVAVIDFRIVLDSTQDSSTAEKGTIRLTRTEAVELVRHLIRTKMQEVSERMIEGSTHRLFLRNKTHGFMDLAIIAEDWPWPTFAVKGGEVYQETVMKRLAERTEGEITLEVRGFFAAESHRHMERYACNRFLLAPEMAKALAAAIASLPHRR